VTSREGGSALHDDCSVVDLSWAGRLELRGRDRNRFLNGLVTTNVKDLAPGSGTYGFLLNKQGRVLADVYVTALEDRLWLELPEGVAGEVRAHIESYKVIDDVEIAPLGDMALIGVLGTGAASLLGPAAETLALDRTARVQLDGCEVQLTHRRVFGVDGFVFWIVSALAEDVVAGLIEKGARETDLAALDARRVELGVGRFGVDFDDETVANETGLVKEAIDFTKGCYLGQEIVARIFYKGKPSQPVSALEVRGRSSAPALPAPIHAHRDDGTLESCGTLTSVTAGAEPGSWLAIGNVSRRALDEGASMVLDGGGEVRVR
jgi:folate-binding protein YgfZ